MEELMLAVLVGSVTSPAVTVLLPAVLSVTLRVVAPEINDAFAGSVALASEEVRATVSVTVLTTFQLLSTALTVTVNAMPAVWAIAVPLLPVGVPGLAVSPGNRTWSLADAAALTWIDGLADCWTDGG